MTASAVRQNDEELALLAQARAGDRGAMKHLYGQHAKRLYCLALRLVGNATEAEDVVQETFLKAWRFGSAFRGDARLGSWLCRIALNESRDALRKRRPESAPAAHEAAPLAPHRDVLDARRLEAAMKTLPEGYREAIVLHDVLGMEHADIAEILGVEIGTSKSQLHKARARMRELLGERA